MCTILIVQQRPAEFRLMVTAMSVISPICTVTSRPSGEQALERIRAGGVDVVIVPSELTDMTVSQFAEAARAADPSLLIGEISWRAWRSPHTDFHIRRQHVPEDLEAALSAVFHLTA